MSETKDDLVEGEKAGEPGQNVVKLLNYRIIFDILNVKIRFLEGVANSIIAVVM